MYCSISKFNLEEMFLVKLKKKVDAIVEETALGTYESA